MVFRALDTESGKSVAVRRFFPFGSDGGGLHAEEQVAYDIAISRLAGLRHPALRSVICGGCDPVDGMPFIATEWVEGESLLPILHEGPLTAESATELITKALEVCELLSQVLAEEAVWVETDIQTIVVGNEESGRGFTFWISPFKWLGGNGETRGLESIVTLAEEVMGWTGLIVSDQAGRGLGGWVKWLRNSAATTSLHEAREMLAASVGVEPPPSAVNLVATAKSSAIKPVKRLRKPKMPVFAMLSLFIAVAALGSWLWIQHTARKVPSRLSTTTPTSRESHPATVPPATRSKPKSAPAPSEPVAPKVPSASHSTPVSNEVERANRRAAELSAQLAGADHAVAENLADQQSAVDQQGGVFSPGHGELLLKNAGKEVAVQGVFENIEFSQTRKTMYLLFAGGTGGRSARGSVLLSKAPADLTENALRPLIGRKIRIRGKVDVRKSSDGDSPLIILTDRASIEIVE